MAIRRIPKKQLAVGLTAYYSGLQPLGDKNPVEMYFFRDILPGYLWIFHLGNGTANVGLAMLSSSITNKGIDLKKKFGELLSGEPLKTRFLTARREGEIKSRILPLGFDKRAISGERFLLTGDAAGLTEPLTGEGVGNALRSGRVASEHILSAFNSNNFSATFNKAYDNEIYRRVMPDFKMNNRLQKLIGHPFLLNFITGSIHKHEDLEKAFNNALIHLQQPSAKSKLLFILKTAYIFTLLKLSKDILTVGTKYFNRKSPDQKEKKNV
jgi:flavin-dependent dehydrogenase